MLTKAKNGIKKAKDHLVVEFSKLQVGRANPAILDGVKIENYGSFQPLSNVASISTLDAQTLSVKPWDKTLIHAIAKAISDASIGLNPQTMADSILISIPQLTEERRKEIAKIVKRLGDEAKVSIRNARSDSNKVINAGEENKEVSEDLAKDLKTDLQKIVDNANKEIDESVKKKEADIMKL